MTEQVPTETPRERFIDVAQRELIAFELKEREFRKRLKKERADELQMPVLKRVYDDRN
jgi:hypothetical protein